MYRQKMDEFILHRFILNENYVVSFIWKVLFWYEESYGYFKLNTNNIIHELLTLNKYVY